MKLASSLQRYKTAKLDMLPKMVEIMRNRTRKYLVYVRCVFIKISRIDTVNEQYYADIFIQAKWKEPFFNKDTFNENEPIDWDKLWNPQLYVENMLGEPKESVSREINFPEEHAPIGFVVEKRRIKANFLETLELKHFPFDCQDLSVVLTSELSFEEMEFCEMSLEMSRINDSRGVESQEWELHKHVEVTRCDLLTDYNIGPARRPTIQFTCRASRRFGFFLTNTYFISCLLAMLAFSSLAVSPENTFGRLQLCMIILLTSITFKVAVSQSLPKISYLTYLDKAIIGNIIVVIVLGIWHAGISYYFQHQQFKNETKITISKKDMMINIYKIRTNERYFTVMFVLLYFTANILFGIVIYLDAGARRRKMRKNDVLFLKRLKTIKSASQRSPLTSVSSFNNNNNNNVTC